MRQKQSGQTVRTEDACLRNPQEPVRRFAEFEGAAQMIVLGPLRHSPRAGNNGAEWLGNFSDS